MARSKLHELVAARDTVRITFSPKVTAQDLHAALDRILTQGGCPACGLNGLDIHIGRLPEIELPRDLANVERIEVLRG